MTKLRFMNLLDQNQFGVSHITKIKLKSAQEEKLLKIFVSPKESKFLKLVL